MHINTWVHRDYKQRLHDVKKEGDDSYTLSIFLVSPDVLSEIFAHLEVRSHRSVARSQDRLLSKPPFI